jgi:hypothetical protein
MNRKDRRAAKVKVSPPPLRELSTALCLAAPWCVRTRWGNDFSHSAVMSFAGSEVLRRHQYAGELATAVLVIGNPKATMCVGDKRAGYNLLARRNAGRVPPFEAWQRETVLGGDADGVHTILRTRDSYTQVFLDLTFGHVAEKTNNAIEAPPAFLAFGNIDWHGVTMGDVWFQYAPAPEPPTPRELDAKDWIGLIDDLAMLVDVALKCSNDAQAFDVEMDLLLRAR